MPGLSRFFSPHTGFSLHFDAFLCLLDTRRCFAPYRGADIHTRRGYTMRFTHHAKLLALGAALAGLVIVPSVGEVSLADPTGACGFPDSDGVYEIWQAHELAEVGSGGTSGECSLSANYRVMNDIPLSPFLNGTSWTPIGNLDAPFTGTFDGGGHDISGLNIQVLEPDASNDVNTPDTLGLFGVVQEGATIENVTLSFVTILLQNNTLAGGYVGALAGINRGTVSNSKVIGPPSETDHYVSGVGVSMTVGGLVGKSTGPVSDSEATILVQGDEFVGGLIGELQGGSLSGSLSGSLVVGINDPEEVGGLVGYAGDTTISNSSASGLVTGEDGVGGLVGEAVRTTIHDSHATGNVSGEDYVGGLVGSIRGVTITGSSATGDVEGAEDVGGLVGLVYEFFNVEPSTVEESFADGAVSGSTNVGGLIGRLQAASTVLESWATGDVSAGDDAEYIGGLVGRLVFGSQIEHSYATGHVTGGKESSWVGGLVGRAEDSAIIASHAEGSVNVGDSSQYIGGLIGRMGDNNRASTVTTSYAIGDVTTGKDVEYVGGLVGAARNESAISSSYATGNVTTSDGASNVGGLAGRVRQSSGVDNSFATGHVHTGTQAINVGGLVGSVANSGSVLDSYATGNVSVTSGGPVGGLIGLSEGGQATPVRESFSTGKVSGTTDSEGAIGQGNWSGVYFDTQSTGLSGLGGSGKTSSELRQLATFVGWDISESATPTTVWGVHPTRNAGYPFLAWQYDGTNQLTAFCEPAEPSLLNPSVGAGVDNPYLISHPRHLLWLAGADFDLDSNSRLTSKDDDEEAEYRLTADYRQVASFSLAECDWLPIGRIRDSEGSIPPFLGSYDGKDNSLVGLVVTGAKPGTRVANINDRIGLFGNLQGSVENLTVSGAVVEGENRVGVVAGETRSGVSLTNITITDAKVSGEQRIGGMAGAHIRSNEGDEGFRVQSCTVEAELLRVGTGGIRAGGIFGFAHEATQTEVGPDDKSSSSISDCSITVEIISPTLGESSTSYVGGVIGNISLKSSTVDSSDGNQPSDGNQRIAMTNLNVDVVVRASGNLRRAGGIAGYGRAVMGDNNAVSFRLENLSGGNVDLQHVGGAIGNSATPDDSHRSLVSDSSFTVTTVGEFSMAGEFGGVVGEGEVDIHRSVTELDVAFNNARDVGGLVGEWRGGEITNSKASGSIDVSNGTSAAAWGGLVGYHGSGVADVVASYTDVTLEATVSTSSNSVDIGGLVGRVSSASPLSIEESYSNTTMTFPDGVEDANAGAFIGRVQSTTEINRSFYNSSRVTPSLDPIGKQETAVSVLPQALQANQINRIAPFAVAGWAIVPATATSLPSGPTDETWGIVEGGTCGPFLWWEEGKADSCQAPVTSGSGGSGGSGGSSGSSSNRPSATEPEVDGTVLLNPVPRGTNLLQGATDNDSVVLPTTPEPSGTDTSDGEATADALSGGEATDTSALPVSPDSGGMGVLWMLALGGLAVLAAGGATAAVLRARGRLV